MKILPAIALFGLSIAGFFAVDTLREGKSLRDILLKSKNIPQLPGAPTWSAPGKEENQITGEVVRIADGDTITIIVPDENGGSPQEIKIRLAGIDAPEKSQDFGTISKRALSDMIWNKPVTVTILDTDRYGRKIGDINVPGMDKTANEEMLEQGYAWHYTQYDKRKSFSAAEARARNTKRGLWQHPNQTPPWLFRKK